MPRYLVTLEYRGTDFRGFQKQPGLPTVQGALEKAILAFTGEETRTYGSGRTDTGVHAVGQAVAFDLSGQVDVEKGMRSLNALLPPGIAVTRLGEVPEDFNPRREAVWREYRYFIFNRQVPSPVFEEFSFHVPGPLDLPLMEQACRLLEGEHDFSAFRLKAEDKTTRRTVLRCGLEETYPGLLCVSVRANAFLFRMVRIMTGALLAVGKGRMSLDELGRHLEGGEKLCADPVPPNGLFLWEVEYPPERLDGAPKY